MNKKVITAKNYYGYANTLKKNDKRIPKYIKQFESRGFDDTEVWSLFTAISKFILPRLKKFRKSALGYPGGMTKESWDTIINKMIHAFELISKDEEDGTEQEGLDLFRKYFFHLWT